jgi:hypothetical protein
MTSANVHPHPLTSQIPCKQRGFLLYSSSTDVSHSPPKGASVGSKFGSTGGFDKR